MEKWTPEEIRQYSASIKSAEKQNAEKAFRKNKWMDDFLDGKEVKQYDEFVNQYNPKGKE